MALVPRYKRRILGEAIIDALEKSTKADRFTRTFLPGPEESDRDTAYLFLTFAIPNFDVGGYEGYTKTRRKLLEIYAFALLEKHRELKRVVGIATETRKEIAQGGGSSEDLIVIEPEPSTWTPEFLKELEELKRNLNMLQEGNFSTYRIQGNEFPEVNLPPSFLPGVPKLNRKQRRANAAKAKKQKKWQA
jgi:hypothetical protein